MAEHDTTRLLESVARMTREQDAGSLEQVLVNTFCERLGMEFAAIFSQPDDDQDDRLMLGSNCGQRRPGDYLDLQRNKWGARFIVTDHVLSQCIESGEPVTTTSVLNARPLNVWPIGRGIDRHHLLIAAPEQGNDIDHDILSTIIDIYSNFLAIIDDGQRDPLTGLLNRKTFDYQINEILATLKTGPTDLPDERRQRHADKQYWLGMFDIDHFKSINDNYGHLYGDEVLLLFAKLMRRMFRSSDLLFRYGGEEFIVVLAPTGQAEAMMVFNRFREAVAAHEFPQIGQVTVSIGVVELLARQHPSSILSNADKALYFAKDHGRNQTCSYQQLLDEGRISPHQTHDDIELFATPDEPDADRPN